VRTGPCSS